MDTCAFVSLEDISDALPAYREDVIPVALEGALKAAYEHLEDEITATLQEHRGNRSVLSTMLNALLVYPDHPYGLGTLYGTRYNPETQQRESFIIAEPEDLDDSKVYPKENALIKEIQAQLARGRKCQVFAVYTNKYDVTARLEKLLRAEGIRADVLRARVPTHKREVLVPRTTKARDRRRHLPSQAGRDRTRPAGVPDHPLPRNRLFPAHSAAGQPALVAHRTKAPGGSEVLRL